MIISHDVIFIENEMYHSSKRGASRENKEIRSQVEFQVEPLEIESQIEDTEIGRQPQEPEFTEEEESVDEYNIARDRPRRVIRPPVGFRLNYMVSFALTVAEDIVDSESRNYKKVIGSKDSMEWLKSMEEEMNSLKKNQAWMLVDKPERQLLVGCKWI